MTLKPPGKPKVPKKDSKSQFDTTPTLDLRRKAQIANGGPKDHGGDLIMVPIKDFDLQRTIFKTLESPVARGAIHVKIGKEPYWTDAAIQRILTEFTSVPAPMPHDKSLLHFMETECDFSTEHADGSFLDHLQFCFEYGSIHYKQHSPRVLYLHSIMGVGTNLFPMPMSKVGKLRALVSEFEMTHIEAFPSILRLLNHQKFLDELIAMDSAGLARIQGVAYHRVIDNEKLRLSAEDLWIHLNYQLIHLLDFLPSNNWQEEYDKDPLMIVFTKLYALLLKSGKLEAKVDFDIQSVGDTPIGQGPLNLGQFLLQNVVPSRTKQKLAKKETERFSNKIGHDLAYNLECRA